MNKFIRNYERFYSQDRATGEHAETASEIRRRKTNKRREQSNAFQLTDTIDSIDLMISQQQVNLENLKNCNNDVGILTSPGAIVRSQAHFESATSHMHKKAKKKHVDEAALLIKEGLDKMSEAIMNSASKLAWRQAYEHIGALDCAIASAHQVLITATESIISILIASIAFYSNFWLMRSIVDV
ncbi:hypothetical protein GH714_010226 [Hevea brasiliensis]|uniref:Uncharacterized protein n=1 Tax=Hevea brasiliensis TaxID=3981 RepID=A0A6A6LJ89_HEVBR|nr:hypothetical protein GH714_010226 [Hevea brasiliensis]